MNNQEIEAIVVRFRDDLQRAGSKFFAAYTVTDPTTNEPGVKITSNSSRDGIRSLLSVIVETTMEGINVLALEIAGSTRAGMDLKPREITQALASGQFHKGAQLLFAQLRKHFTIVGWEESLPKAGAAKPSKVD